MLATRLPLVYDLHGHRVLRTAEADGAVESYGYDSQNRLISYRSTAGEATFYRYDALDRRIAKVSGTQAEVYVLDAWSLDPTASEVVLDFAVSDPSAGSANAGQIDSLSAQCDAELAPTSRGVSIFFSAPFPISEPTRQRIEWAGLPSPSVTVSFVREEALPVRQALTHALEGRASTSCSDVANLFEASGSGTDITLVAADADVTLERRWLHGPRVDEPLEVESYAGSLRSLLANRLGSIAVAVSVATGAVASEVEYDSFGQREIVQGVETASSIAATGTTASAATTEPPFKICLILVHLKHLAPEIRGVSSASWC